MRKRIFIGLLILLTFIFATSCDTSTYTSLLSALQGNQYIAMGLVDSPDIVSSYEVTTSTTTASATKETKNSDDGKTTYTVKIELSTSDESLTDEQKTAYSTINSVLSSLTVTSEALADKLVSDSSSSSTLSILAPSTTEEAETISELVSVSASSTAASAQFVETYSAEVEDDDIANATVGTIAVFAAVLDSYTTEYSDDLKKAAEEDETVAALVSYVEELTETLTTIATSDDITVTEGDVLQAQLLLDFTTSIVDVLDEALGTSSSSSTGDSSSSGDSSSDTDLSSVITSAIDSLTTIEAAASLLSDSSGCLSGIGLDSIISSVLGALTSSST